MSHGYTASYEVHELEEIETVEAPLLLDLADRIKGIVLPQNR